MTFWIRQWMMGFPEHVSVRWAFRMLAAATLTVLTVQMVDRVQAVGKTPSAASERAAGP